MKIAVIGSNNVDLFTTVANFPLPGQTVLAESFRVGFGGKGANQAVAARKLGADVTFVGRVGDDVFGDLVLANLTDMGLATEHVQRARGASTGVATILLEASAQNRILVVPGANFALLPADIDALADPLSACALIVLQLEVPLPTVYRVIDLAHSAQVPVLLNPAPAVAGFDLEYLARCQYVVPNETELALLSGMAVDSESALLSAAQSLLQRGLRNLVVTCGAEGALWLAPESAVMRFAAPLVDAVDTTGAGDAFVGCFAAALVDNGLAALPASERTAEAIRRAIFYASHSVTLRGTHTAYVDAATFASLACPH